MLKRQKHDLLVCDTSDVMKTKATLHFALALMLKRQKHDLLVCGTSDVMETKATLHFAYHKLNTSRIKVINSTAITLKPFVNNNERFSLDQTML